MHSPSSPSHPRRAVQIQPGADAGERAGTRAELVIFWARAGPTGGRAPDGRRRDVVGPGTALFLTTRLIPVLRKDVLGTNSLNARDDVLNDGWETLSQKIFSELDSFHAATDACLVPGATT